MVDLDTPVQNGRVQCIKCNSRHTEIVSSWGNKQSIQCQDCNAEFKQYTGTPCSVCNSQNTKERTVGATPHRRKVRTCYDCDCEETVHSLDTTYTGQ